MQARGVGVRLQPRPGQRDIGGFEGVRFREQPRRVLFVKAEHREKGRILRRGLFGQPSRLRRGRQVIEAGPEGALPEFFEREEVRRPEILGPLPGGRGGEELRRWCSLRERRVQLEQLVV